MASEGFHEPLSKLDEGVIDRHRIITSIMEEFEAVDWYDQRVAATDDASLAAVLAHNRDEEKEHAAMGIEWLRRHDETFDAELRTYLFTDVPITEVEEAAMGGDDSNDTGSPTGGEAEGSAEAVGAPDVQRSRDTHSLRIGSLKETPGRDQS
ncbi:MAG: ferritin [Microthrixaceae bacterium]|nr:ferritin [Microthrixaceae bacterium]MCB1010297.1 ferritin [Microthrixaceae bacterium]MCB9387675.1 ferritin [Microthrixaceae bacterium]MCO5320697.1 ferritin-like domain-containing protein [Microthrixaceae bacterium]